MNSWWKTILVTIGMFVLTRNAWATPQEAPGQDLKQRASLFWQTRARADWATNYQFLMPEEKTTVTQKQFITFNKKTELLRYLSVRTGVVSVDGDLGWVEVTYQARLKKYPEVKPITFTFWDHWQQQDGQWYPVPKNQRKYLPQLPPHLRPAEEEAVLSQRVQQFSKAKEQQDLASLYQYLEPRYQEKVPLDEFTKKTAKNFYLSHRLEWVEVLGEKGRAKVVYTYKINDPSLSKLDPQEEVALEEWTKIDGQWYHRMIVPE